MGLLDSNKVKLASKFLSAETASIQGHNTYVKEIINVESYPKVVIEIMSLSADVPLDIIVKGGSSSTRYPMNCVMYKQEYGQLFQVQRINGEGRYIINTEDVKYIGLYNSNGANVDITYNVLMKDGEIQKPQENEPVEIVENQFKEVFYEKNVDLSTRRTLFGEILADINHYDYAKIEIKFSSKEEKPAIYINSINYVPVISDNGEIHTFIRESGEYIVDTKELQMGVLLYNYKALANTTASIRIFLIKGNTSLPSIKPVQEISTSVVTMAANAGDTEEIKEYHIPFHYDEIANDMKYFKYFFIVANTSGGTNFYIEAQPVYLRHTYDKYQGSQYNIAREKVLDCAGHSGGASDWFKNRFEYAEFYLMQKGYTKQTDVLIHLYGVR